MSKQNNKINIGSIINITLRLFVVCTVIAAVVAGVYTLTYEKIAENEQKVIDTTIRSVFPTGIIEKMEYADESTVNSIYAIKNEDDDSIAGYSVICAPKGFGGEIRMLVAFDSDKKINAVRIMSHSETPGIGDKISSEDHKTFTDQFKSKTGELVFGKDGIDKITGSSKSSNAVLKGVNDAVTAVNYVN